jgi:signal transduction histidine kinase
MFERRVLIVAPTGNDAGLTAEFIQQANLSPQICRDVAQLAEEVKRGCGVIVLAEEILGQSSITLLIQTLAEQPPWSDIPIVLITSSGEVSQAHLRRLVIFGPGGNVVLLERPFRLGTLLSTLEVSLRSRQRQYEARDLILELKRVHDEIQAASRAKDDFLAALSHELRTPLNPVLLIASENAADPELSPKMRADFEMVRKNIELEARLIDDLLDLTRISRGKLILNKSPCDVHAILNDAVATVEAEIKKKNLALKLELQAGSHRVLGDAVRLQQIFWNVLKNAVKFTPENGQISVKTSTLPEEETIIIKVIDTGIGMTTREIAHIFAAFTQGEHARGGGGSHRFGGLGLGLAISRMLVKLHSGLIYATSTGHDRGSTFTIKLPLAQKKAGSEPGKDSRPPPDQAPPAKNPGLRILLVEDHEPTRIALANLLSRREYTVSTAATVGEAQGFAAQNKFDLVVSDIGLPDGTGYELMSKLRDDFGLRGIALTGYGMEQDVDRGKRAGFVAHLVKPIRIEALEKILSGFDGGE